MLRKKVKYLVAALLAVVMFFSFSSNIDKSETAFPQTTAQAADVTVVPKYTPSSDPVKFLFIYWTSGFSLQPQSQYTYIGQPVTLSTNVSLNALDTGLSLIIPFFGYQWWQSTDGATWTKVSNGTKKNLTLTPTSTGTTYYQLAYEKAGLLITYSAYYSKVASITTEPDPIDATGVSVSVDDDYLYNNQSSAASTFAHATPNPYNSTAKLSWSVDNTDLATIDSTTGQLTANTSGKSGTVKAIATLTNSDGSTVTGSKDVTIGGGLDDQTVNEGSAATFNIDGNWDNTPDSVVWHKVQNGTDSVISGATGMSYTTPDTAYADNGAQFYAVMKVSQDNGNGGTSTTTVTTNKATLTVIPNTTPKVIINSNIYNNTYNSHNDTDTEISNIMAGDELVIKGTITDENANSIMAAGQLSIKIPGNMAPDTVMIDGTKYSDYYITADPNDPTMSYLKITNINMTTSKSHSFEIDMPAESNGNISVDATPTLIGADADENQLPDTYVGNGLTMNFSDGQLDAQAHDISYGQLQYSSVGKPVEGTVDTNDNPENNILSVSDNRRDKQDTHIYLSQQTPFNSNGNKLSSELRYYTGNSYQVLTDQNLLISNTAAGDSVNSIENNSSNGLRLYIFDSNLVYGQYTSELDWTVVNGPQ